MGISCVSRTLQVFVCSWKSGIHAYTASTPNPSVQQLCWPILKTERSCSVVTAVDVGRTGTWSGGSSGSHSQSQGEGSQVPVSNIKAIKFFYSLTIMESISLLFLFCWTCKSRGSPTWPAGAQDCPDWALPLPWCELSHRLAEDGALISVASVNFGCGSQRDVLCCICMTSLDALRYLKWH